MWLFRKAVYLLVVFLLVVATKSCQSALDSFVANVELPKVTLTVPSNLWADLEQKERTMFFPARAGTVCELWNDTPHQPKANAKMPMGDYYSVNCAITADVEIHGWVDVNDVRR